MSETVPCGACTLCCRNKPAIILHPEKGDDPRNYGTLIPMAHPLQPGKMAYRLPHKADGSCVFLGPFGCAVWAKRPAMCRSFDCRVLAQRGDALKANFTKLDGKDQWDEGLLAKGCEMLEKYPL